MDGQSKNELTRSAQGPALCTWNGFILAGQRLSVIMSSLIGSEILSKHAGPLPLKPIQYCGYKNECGRLYVEYQAI